MYSENIVRESKLEKDYYISKLITSLTLLSGDEKFIKSLEIEPMHELALHFVYSMPLPTEDEKKQIKLTVMDRINKLKEADFKQFNTDLVEYALENPYDKYKKLKESYPAWFSEYIVFLWDASGFLNSEEFEIDRDAAKQINTTIVEEVTAEYVRYLIELR